jgi:hypothetical protein
MKQYPNPKCKLHILGFFWIIKEPVASNSISNENFDRKDDCSTHNHERDCDLYEGADMTLQL